MAAKSLVPADEDEFIDMEFTSFSNFLLSPPNPNSSSEFEFQMSSSSSSSIFQHSEASSVTSPADELFYKGKLLPLHLPPRLQMLQHILQNEQNHSLPLTSSGSLNDSISDNRSQRDNQGDLMTSYSSTPITVTPFEPCNVSSYESSRVNDHGMLNPKEEEENHDSVEGAEKNQKKMKKKKNMKKQQKKQYFSLTSKLRAWFGKVSCKFELAYATKKVADEGSASKARKSSNLNHHKQINGKVEVGKKLYPFGRTIQTSDRNRFGSLSSRIEFRSIDIDTDYSDDGGAKSNRSIMRSSLVGNNKSRFNGSASFSGLPNKSLYGSCQELEIGNLIMGAIAHCKQSHHQQYFNQLISN